MSEGKAKKMCEDPRFSCPKRLFQEFFSAPGRGVDCQNVLLNAFDDRKHPKLASDIYTVLCSKDPRKQL
jgi:hypothetical protein